MPQPSLGQQEFDNQHIGDRAQIPPSPQVFVIGPPAIAAGFLFGVDGRVYSHRMRKTKNEGGILPPGGPVMRTLAPPSRDQRS